MEKKMWGQYALMIAAALLLVGGVVVAAEGLLFRDCNNCTVNVPPSNVVQEVQQPVVEERLGSVSKTSEYHSTTTGAYTKLLNTTDLVISTNTAWRWNSDENATRQGALGSIVMISPRAGAGMGGTIDFYDATTTNPLQRANGMSSSSILLTSIPINFTTGTYTFDILYQYGLIAVFDRAIVPTTTITYR